MVVALALKPAPHRELERTGHSLLGPLDNSTECTAFFRGSIFDWDRPRDFQLPMTKTNGTLIRPTYRSLGLRGRTADDHDIFQVSVDLDIKGRNGYRTVVQPLGQIFFEVDQNDIIERCHVRVNEDRGFDCLLERGELQANGDCMLPSQNKAQCTTFGGHLEAGRFCRIGARQPIPKRTATEAFRSEENRWERCGQKGWFRMVTCIGGGRHCRPATLCQRRGGTKT
jgi:hypothetical protein